MSPELNSALVTLVYTCNFTLWAWMISIILLIGVKYYFEVMKGR